MFLRSHEIVSCKVSCGSRGKKPSWSIAFVESKYQKHSACSTSLGITGDGRPQCLYTEAIMLEPAIANFFGTFIDGAETPLSLSSRPKNC